MAFELSQLLEKSTQRAPEKIAVRARGRSATYAEVDAGANRLAHLLRDQGVQKGDRVGLHFPKSVESVVAMLGVLRAGAAYVPLDPLAPGRRIAYIAGNCGLKGLLTDSERGSALDRSGAPRPGFRLLVDDPTPGRDGAPGWAALEAFPSTRPPGDPPLESDLAYILYTSGSTGEPKGVMITHRNALTFVDWCADTFAIGPEDRLSNHAPLHFDLSVFDVYNALGAGATVSLIDEETAVFPANLAAFIEKEEISVWYSVPSALIGLMVHGGLEKRDLHRLRLVLFAGEVFPMKHLRRLAAQLPRPELYNLFGPTETNVCTYHRVDRSRVEQQETLPIGRPCANTDVFVVGDSGELAAPGEVGELFVRGPSVTKGYWGDPEKTRRSVVPNRFQPHFDEPVYRTGDLVVLEDGEYRFLGRRDHMIKSRGYRIELGEIETALYSHPEIQEAAAVAIPDEEIGNRIKAFVVPRVAGSLSVAQIRQHCAQRIPKYMIPEIIELSAGLPKTSTGKVDRSRLVAGKETTEGTA